MKFSKRFKDTLESVPTIKELEDNLRGGNGGAGGAVIF